jgi:hypothetical protein
MSTYRIEGMPSPILALGGFGSVIGAALGALATGGGAGFTGIVIGAFVGVLCGMTLGRMIR